MAVDPRPDEDEAMRSFVESFLRFVSTDGNEAPAQAWLLDRLDTFGFETYSWEADSTQLAQHESFPDDPAAIETADRPSVAGVLEFGDPAAGPTLVFNGHTDVVPVEPSAWSSDPFEPTWVDEQHLRARGAADMKSAVTACIFAAQRLADADVDLDGRLVVESVVGEEAGGIGAAAAALSNPYPFERDAALVAEPTEGRVVTAVEGSVMKELTLTGRAAHAASRWRGESVLPHFFELYDAIYDFEAERSTSVSHPLYEEYEIPWPITIGVVEAGNWASTVPASLRARMRVGVAPGESVDAVEAALEERVAAAVAENEWLSEHEPGFERFSVQFEPAEVSPDERVVSTLQSVLADRGHDTAPIGATYGADNRHYLAAGIPTVVYGPGTIEQAHFPDETIDWREVREATTVLTETARRYLAS